MILTPSDIKRLESLGYKREFFAVFDGRYWRLRNVDGRCVFLREDGRCSVYQYRPLGCRAYPVIVDESTNACVVDAEYCPLADKLTASEYLKGCLILRKIFRELGEEEPKPKFPVA